MLNPDGRNIGGPIIALTTVLALVVLLSLFNKNIEKDLEKAVAVPARPVTMSQPLSPSAQAVFSKDAVSVPSNFVQAGDVIKKTRIERGHDYEESIFYLNSREIAREKISKEGVQATGVIPDGKVKIINTFNNCYGEEHYKNGKREGMSRIYYPNGKLKLEAEYIAGKIQTYKEYYTNNNLSEEIDYRDARHRPGDKEVGVGKVYYMDGTLKYEWSVTNSNRIDYKKSYNQDGQLRYEADFDSQGRLTNETRQAPDP